MHGLRDRTAAEREAAPARGAVTLKCPPEAEAVRHGEVAGEGRKVESHRLSRVTRRVPIGAQRGTELVQRPIPIAPVRSVAHDPRANAVCARRAHHHVVRQRSQARARAGDPVTPCPLACAPPPPAAARAVPSSPEEYFDELADRVPGAARQTMDGLGHLLCMEDPRRTGTGVCRRCVCAE